ncbi:MAG: UDP-N-acetylglucosamine 2-epimerase [Nitriliruptor sp.]
MTASLHVFIGTKAQYVKTAPLLRLLDERGVAYRLIDSGQHAALSRELRRELGVRDPDVTLGGARDITTIPAAIRWAATIALRLLDRAKVRRELFGLPPEPRSCSDMGVQDPGSLHNRAGRAPRRLARPGRPGRPERPGRPGWPGRPGRSGRGVEGICVVHGDTPSTLLAALLARRAGLEVAHLEAGLRSRSVFEPFPEELIRRVVMRLSSLLFAPDGVAEANLRRRGLGDRTVRTSANTVVDALRYSLAETPVAPTGPSVVTMHRVENLHRPERVRGFVDLVERLARNGPVTFVVHGPTESAIAPHRDRLTAAGVELVSLLPHAAFTRLLAAAPLVVTDGGSIQEECALLGVPTLLWRAQTERPDGIGDNVVLSAYDPATIEAFVRDPAALRRTPLTTQVHPSAEILEELQRRLGVG